MPVDRRIRAILARLSTSSGGEAVAALDALRRVLPEKTSLADILFIGLHYSQHDNVDPSLIAENRRLALQLENALKQQEALGRRAETLESTLRDVLAILSARPR